MADLNYIPARARQDFGFGANPWQAYFPTAQPPTPSRYDVATSGYSPFEDLEAQQRANAQLGMLTEDFSTPQGVTGLQRLVAQGYVKPQQATAIARLNRITNQRTQAAQDALADFSSINPLSEDASDQFNQLVEKHRTTGAIQDPKVVQAMQRAQGLLYNRAVATKPKAPDRKLLEAYSEAATNPSDPAKFKYIKDVLGNPNPSSASSEDWKKAFNEVHAGHLNRLAGLAAAAKAAGQAVPPEVEALLGGNATQTTQNTPQVVPNMGQPTLTPADLGATAGKAEANTQPQASHVVLPNGRVAYFKDPAEAQAFKSKYGLQ